jgi:hypothetical protein
MFIPETHSAELHTGGYLRLTVCDIFRKRKYKLLSSNICTLRHIRIEINHGSENVF